MPLLEPSPEELIVLGRNAWRSERFRLIEGLNRNGCLNNWISENCGLSNQQLKERLQLESVRP